VTVEGGELLAFGSANPRTEESYNNRFIYGILRSRTGSDTRRGDRRYDYIHRGEVDAEAGGCLQVSKFDNISSKRTSAIQMCVF
jgi:hypothetical protein